MGRHLQARRWSRLGPLLVLALLSAAGPALGQRLERGQTILDRPRPEYEAQGVPVAAFLLQPSLTLRQAYVDNLRAEADGGEADFVTQVAPEVSLRSQWPRHAAGLQARASQARYWEQHDENTRTWRLGGNARLDLGRRSHLRSSVGWEQRVEDRAAPDAADTREPITFNVLVVNVGAQAYDPQVTVTLGGDLRRYDYKDGLTREGAIVSNDDRDHTQVDLTSRLAIPAARHVDLLLNSKLDFRQYDEPLDDAGFVRDSWGMEATGGVRFNLTGLTFGEARLGWRQQYYTDTAFSTVSGLTGQLSVTSSLTELTSLRMAVDRTIKETTIPGAAGIQVTSASLRADHELLPNLLLDASLVSAWQAFEDIPRDDHVFAVELGSRYLMNRWLSWSVDVRYERRDSNAVDANYTRSAVSLSAQLQY